MNALPAVARRIMAVGLLIIMVLSVWSLVIHPLYRATNIAMDELDDARFELHRLALLAEDAAQTGPDTTDADLDALRHELFAMRGGSESDALFVSAVDQLIRDGGVRLLQLKSVSPVRAGSLTRYAVDIHATGREADFVPLLASIEEHRPRLVVDRLTLLAQGSPEVGDAPELTIELRVSGFASDLDAIASAADPDAR